MSTPITKSYKSLLTLLLSMSMLTIPYAKSMTGDFPSDSDGNKEKEICVFLDGIAVTARLNDWDCRKVPEFKMFILRQFANKGSFKKIENWDYENFLLFDYEDEFDNDVMFEVDRSQINNVTDDGSLQLVLVHKSNKQAFLQFFARNSNGCVEFKHNYDLFDQIEIEEETKDSDHDDRKSDEAIFYVYFKGKKVPLEVHRFEGEKGKDIIQAYFNEMNIHESADSYKLVWTDYNLIEEVRLNIAISFNDEVAYRLSPNDKWAIIKNEVEKWDDRLVQTDNEGELEEVEDDEEVEDEDDEEIEDEDDEEVEYEDGKEVEDDNFNSDYISVFFNRKEYQVPRSLYRKNVEQIMTQVVRKLPSPFNTIIPSRILLVTSNKGILCIKTTQNQNLHTISSQWLAVEKKTLHEFLNWKVHKDYFRQAVFDDYEIEELEIDFEEIKNYCNIYPQCHGQIIARERNPLYGSFYNHLASNMCHLLEKCASEAYYNLYRRWEQSEIDGECPITLMAGLDNISNVLNPKQTEEKSNNEEKAPELLNTSEVQNETDLEVNLINNIQDDYFDANEFHIIETKDIVDFRTKIYKKYNTRRRPPINPGNLRVLFYHKYVDMKALPQNYDKNTEYDGRAFLKNLKRQALEKAFNEPPSDEDNALILMSGKTNLDDLYESKGHEAILPHLQQGKTLTLIPSYTPGLVEAYNNSVDDNVDSNSKKYIIIATSLAAVLALVTSSKKKINTQPAPIGGPKDNILVSVVTHSEK